MNLDTRLTCPKCGCSSAMRAFQNEEVIELMKVAGRFGKNLAWAIEYVHCFQTDHDKPLKPSRVKILLQEILEMVDRKGFAYDRQEHAVRPDALFQAIRVVAGYNKTGFKNHNYMKKTAININLKLISDEEKGQREKEADAMRREYDPEQGMKKIKEIYNSL